MAGWDPTRSYEEILQELTAEATQRWGTERAAALGPNLSNAARDLWLLAQQQLGPADAMLDLTPHPERR